MRAIDAVHQLEQLGSPSAIADHLAQLGHVGNPDNGCECPVARYIAAETGREAFVCTTSCVEADGTPHEMCDTVARFIEEFDAGVYPHLEEAGR